MQFLFTDVQPVTPTCLKLVVIIDNLHCPESTTELSNELMAAVIKQKKFNFLALAKLFKISLFGTEY